MSERKIGICVCARVNSRRLPNKVLRNVGYRRGRKQPAIELLLHNLILNNNRYPVVLAIPEARENDKIINAVHAANIPVKIYRGQDNSPLHRLVAVAKQEGWEYVVRVTADDLFIDMALLKAQIEWCLDNDLDYVFMGSCPEGVAGEVIRVKTLEDIVGEIGDQPVEYVSYLLKREGVKYAEFYPRRSYQHQFRLTLDYAEDLQLIRIINANLRNGYDTWDIIQYLSRHKYLLEINRLPRVTIYVTNYNYSQYVIQAIQSVITQTFYDWELIVIDDNSRDESVRVIMQYISGLNWQVRNKIRVFVNDRNMGLPWSCNWALDEARGRYILRLDSDDRLRPDAIEKLVREMDLEPGTHGVFSAFVNIGQDGAPIETPARANETAKHPGCCMLNKACVNEIKYRDGLPYFEGAEFMARFEKLYRTKYLDQVLWEYRRHPGQKTDPKNTEAREKVKKQLAAEGVNVK